MEECKIMCTHHSIDLKEKLFFRIIYETQLRPFEVLNLQVEQWDRKQGFVTALKVKQKTKPRKGDHRAKEWLHSTPKTRAITPSTNEMLREYVSNRKKGPIFINENGEMLSLEWFNQEISRYAKLLGSNTFEPRQQAEAKQVAECKGDLALPVVSKRPIYNIV